MKAGGSDLFRLLDDHQEVMSFVQSRHKQVPMTNGLPAQQSRGLLSFQWCLNYGLIQGQETVVSSRTLGQTRRTLMVYFSVQRGLSSQKKHRHSQGHLLGPNANFLAEEENRTRQSSPLAEDVQNPNLEEVVGEVFRLDDLDQVSSRGLFQT